MHFDGTTSRGAILPLTPTDFPFASLPLAFMSKKILRSRIVLPISRPPIEDGAVRIENEHIVEVGRFRDLAQAEGHQLIDLGESILLPGLINCHCHLDYTDMAGMIPQLKSFSDWNKSIIAIKASWGYTEFAQSWVKGARMLEVSGTTSVVDIEAVPELLPEVWQDTPLRVRSCFELINLRSKNNPKDLVDASVRRSHELEADQRNRCGLSPHALYTTTTALRQAAIDRVQTENRLLTTHVAESKEEADMYLSASGPLHDWLSPQNNGEHCGTGSPVQILERTGYLRYPLLAAHVNELAPGDEQRLANNNASVVHCPQSHSFFQHSAFPWERLAKAGVNLTLGTDSLASVIQNKHQQTRLDLFAEMALLADQESAPDPTTILRWATINGAKALFQSNELGQLSPGYLADMIAIPYSESLSKAAEGVVSHQGPVSLSLIGGETIYPRATPEAAPALGAAHEGGGKDQA